MDGLPTYLELSIWLITFQDNPIIYLRIACHTLRMIRMSTFSTTSSVLPLNPCRTLFTLDFNIQHILVTMDSPILNQETFEIVPNSTSVRTYICQIQPVPA